MDALKRILEGARRAGRAAADRTGLTRLVLKLPPPARKIAGRYAPVLVVFVVIGLLAATLTGGGGPGTDGASGGDDLVEDLGDDGTILPGPTGSLTPSAFATTTRPGAAPPSVIRKQFRQPPTANVCGRNGILDTGSAVQFPWAVQCLPDFAGDNGGQTARGVYRDRIRVAFYVTTDPVIVGATKQAGGCGEEACTRDYLDAYIQWFKRYYQLYGRDIEVVYVRGSGRENDVTAAKNDARRIADLDPPVFATLDGPDEAGAAFAEELAANGILCFCTVSLPQEFYDEHSPYVWSTLMSSTQAYIHRAEYVGQRLAGRQARWAGSEALRAQQRRFGLVWFDNDRGDYASGVAFFEDELAKYGVTLARKVRYNNIEGCQIDSTNIVTQLASVQPPITSVIFSGDPICPISLTKAARTQQAKWEWIITGSVLTDTNNFGRLYDSEQWARAFGVSMLQPDVRNDQEYWFKMYKEIRPNGDPKEEAPVVLSPAILFFTGVHLAGPRLTPATFKAGMAKAIATGGSVTLPRRSYGPKKGAGHSIWDTNSYDDMTEIWWDPAAVDPNGRTGAYWYMNGGTRYLWGAWPSTEPKAFSKAGAVLGYTNPPDQ